MKIVPTKTGFTQAIDASDEDYFDELIPIPAETHVTPPVTPSFEMIQLNRRQRRLEEKIARGRVFDNTTKSFVAGTRKQAKKQAKENFANRREAERQRDLRAKNANADSK